MLERDLLAGDGRLQQGVGHDVRQRFPARRIFRQHLQVPIGRLVSDVRRHRADHLLGYQFARLHAVDDFRWAVVMDADLVQIHVLAGLRVGPQSLEDLDIVAILLAVLFGPNFVAHSDEALNNIRE